MAQAAIEKNIYCQQTGDVIQLVYVNEPLLEINIYNLDNSTEREFDEKELFDMGTKFFQVIKETPSLNERLYKIAEAYKKNPNRDGVVFVIEC